MKTIKKIKDYIEIISIIILIIIIMLVYTTADIDVIPPNIINIQSFNETATSIIITWQTDEPSKSIVSYGTSSGYYEYSIQDNNYKNQHLIIIQNLTPQTIYYYRIISEDPAQNTNISDEYQFTTSQDLNSPYYTAIFQLPETNNSYNQTQIYLFGINWKDNHAINEVSITHNFKGAQETKIITNQTNLSNYTLSYIMNNPSLNNYYFFEISGIKPGIYYWFMNASDLSGNKASTNQIIYEVKKSEPKINFTINNLKQQTINAYTNETLNISVKAITPANSLIEVLIDGVFLPPSGSVLSFLRNFSSPGLYEIKARINETENFTSITEIIYVNVTNPKIILASNKKNYVIGETASFTFQFPQGSIIEWEICGPIPSGGGFAECSIPQTLSGISSPYAIVHSYTNKSGNYSIKVQANYNGMLLETKEYYYVINSINPNIEGSTEGSLGEELTIRSSATGGISPYTYRWRLSNNSIINDQELRIKYNSKGTYPVNLTINDSKGNTFSNIINIIIREKHLIKIIIEDSETKEKISGARIRVSSQEKTT